MRDSVAQQGADPVRHARLAVSKTGLRIFVVGDEDSETLCLVVYDRAMAMSNCSSKKTDLRDGMIWLSHPKGHGLMDVYGLVRDGSEAASVGSRREPVQSNVFVVKDAPVGSESIVLDQGPQKRTLDIGRQVPEGVSIAPDS
ncbi:MAG: hypothetical protein ACRDPL_12245 [Propionibacteriaceae bacterium]|jgi:hypothetical protein